MSRTVGLDLDGTLCRHPFFALVVQRLEQELGPGLVQYLNQQAARLAQAQAWREAYDWDLHVSRFVRERGLPPPRPLTEILEDMLASLSHADRAALVYPEVTESLARLREAGFTLLCVTNGLRRYQEPILRACGLLPYLSGLVTPEETGAAKPSPAIFAGLDLAVYVGDYAPHDVVGARRAGVTPVWLHRSLPPKWRRVPPAERARHFRRISLGAAAVVGHLGELLPLLQPS